MNDLTAIVRRVLEQYPQTRNSGTLLYLKVLQAVCESNGMNLRELSVAEYEQYEHLFPNIQTLKQVRKSLRAEFPLL